MDGDDLRGLTTGWVTGLVLPEMMRRTTAMPAPRLTRVLQLAAQQFPHDGGYFLNGLHRITMNGTGRHRPGDVRTGLSQAAEALAALAAEESGDEARALQRLAAAAHALNTHRHHYDCDRVVEEFTSPAALYVLARPGDVGPPKAWTDAIRQVTIVERTSAGHTLLDLLERDAPWQDALIATEMMSGRGVAADGEWTRLDVQQ